MQKWCGHNQIFVLQAKQPSSPLHRSQLWLAFVTGHQGSTVCFWICSEEFYQLCPPHLLQNEFIPEQALCSERGDIILD